MSEKSGSQEIPVIAGDQVMFEGRKATVTEVNNLEGNLEITFENGETYDLPILNLTDESGTWETPGPFRSHFAGDLEFLD